MDLRAGQRVLDLGCGAGWATRLLARAVMQDSIGEANVVGLDVSDEMIRLARETSREFSSVRFVVGSATQFPSATISSIEFCPSSRSTTILIGFGSRRVFRVMAPGARPVYFINLYTDNEYSLQWWTS